MTDLIPRDAAIAAMEDEADRCDDAVKWGGSRQYIQDCKAAAFAMRSRVPVLRAIPTIDPAAIREAALREAAKRVTELMTREVKSAVGEGYNLGLGTAYDAILALIGEKK